MFVAMGLIKKKEGMSTDEFRDHWINVHGPIAAKLPGVKSYVQNHVIHVQEFDVQESAGTFYDGISMLVYESEEARLECQKSEVFQAIKEDEKNFMEDIDFLFTDRLVVKEPPSEQEECIKRVSFITKHPDMSYDRFRFEWQYFHAGLIRDQVPQVIGYHQNWVDARFSPRGTEATAEQLPVDGVVELWFKNEDEIAQAFSYDTFAGRALSLHTKVLVGTVTPYLVKQYTII